MFNNRKTLVKTHFRYNKCLPASIRRLEKNKRAPSLEGEKKRNLTCRSGNNTRGGNHHGSFYIADVLISIVTIYAVDGEHEGVRLLSVRESRHLFFFLFLFFFSISPLEIKRDSISCLRSSLSFAFSSSLLLELRSDERRRQRGLKFL